MLRKDLDLRLPKPYLTIFLEKCICLIFIQCSMMR